MSRAGFTGDNGDRLFNYHNGVNCVAYRDIELYDYANRRHTTITEFCDAVRQAAIGLTDAHVVGNNEGYDDDPNIVISVCGDRKLTPNETQRINEAKAFEKRRLDYMNKFPG